MIEPYLLAADEPEKVRENKSESVYMYIIIWRHTERERKEREERF